MGGVEEKEVYIRKMGQGAEQKSSNDAKPQQLQQQ